MVPKTVSSRFHLSNGTRFNSKEEEEEHAEVQANIYIHIES